MKYIILLILTLFLFSCREVDNTNVKSVITTADKKYHIIELDECEYIEYEYANNSSTGLYTLAHKGNCKYCKQRNPCQ